MNYELHPLCSLFPRMGDAEFSALVSDIRANGLRQPIVLHEGMILDGGNRYRACIEAGVQPAFIDFDGGSILSFVLSANLHRRHMSAGQQAAIVASAQDWAKSQTQGGDRRSDQSAILHLDSAAGRAAESGASLRTQKMADKVAKEAPDLAKEVGRGAMSLPEAVEKVTGKRPGAKPRPAPVPEPANDDGAPDEAELAMAEAQDAADRELLDKLIAADDKLAAAVAECKRQAAEIVVLRSRIVGLQNEANEAKRLAKHWQRQAAKVA
jgi:hypothetical protein